LHLLGILFQHLSHVLRLFFFSSISDRVSCFCQGQPQVTILLPTEIRAANHHTQLICWDRVSIAFCRNWPCISILLISASQVAEIIGTSNRTCPPYNSSYLILLPLFTLGKSIFSLGKVNKHCALIEISDPLQDVDHS
jgi:hypothetical protein